jgi:hypothetical protein
MRRRMSLVLAVVAFAIPLSTFAQKAVSAPKEDQNSLIITFKDGHQKSYLMADIARIELNTASSVVAGKGQNRFLGKWKVGDGEGSTFYITLEPDGVARKSIGANHGTWTTVDNEARITWDDGWHDAIRKNGTRYEKAAFAAGKSFTDQPDNVTKAENTEAKPL